MQFNEYDFLWPPRPSAKTAPELLGRYSRDGWVAQYKKNGTCNVLYVNPERELIVRTRHDTEHKRWSPTEKSSAPFKALPGSGWYVFVTEVMDNKTSEKIKDTHYIFDILVADGEYLVGTTFAERQEMLKELFLKGDEEECYSHWVINSNVWLAKSITGKFKPLWREVNEWAKNIDGAPTDEGLVLKDPEAQLELCSREGSNSGWMIKCRVEHDNYTF